MAKKNNYNDLRRKQEQTWIKQNLSTDEDFGKLLANYYQEALKQIESEIKDQYIRYAGKNGYSMKEAMKKVSEADVKAFSDKAREIVKQAQVIAKKKGKATRKDFTEYINQQLKLYNATMRINRLEMLKSKMGLEMLQAGMQVDDELQEKLTKDYQDEIRRQAGILKVDLPPDLAKTSAIFKKVVASQEGTTYSQRIWANNAALKSTLESELTRLTVQGLNPRKIAKNLRKLVDKSQKNVTFVTERLARTESARIQHQAQLDMYEKHEIDKVQWIAEPGACSICKPMDRKVFDRDEVLDIPVHPNCRCAIAGYIED